MDRIYLSLACLTLTIACCCSQKPPQFPDINNLITNGFTSKAEITVMAEAKGYSVLVEEFYHVSNKLTKVKTLKAGHRRTVILNAKTNQLALIEYNTCSVQSYENIKTVADPSFPSWLYSPANSDETFYGPTSILRRAVDKPPVYKGNEIFRGVSCHKFQGDGPNGGKIDYYFTANWTTPINISKYVMIPVQIRLSVSDDQYQDVSYVYFKPAVSDRKVFEVSYGIGCEGLKNNAFVKMPSMPKRFTVSGEQLSALDTSADTYVDTFRVWYDSTSNLARLDIFTEKDRGISKVLDYNTGVMYVTRDSQECSAVPLEDSYFDEITDDLKLVMKDPDSALGMNGEFYYLGKQTTRGILCDVWEKVTPNATIKDLVVNRMVFTHFISSSWWEVAVDSEVEEQVPIRLEINTYVEATESPFATTVFNFFQFRKHPPLVFSPFNILNCASDASATKYIAIIIYVDDEELARDAEGEAPMFRELARKKIRELATVSPIRLPFVRVDYSPAAITIMALILERAPAIAQFVELDESNPRKKEIKKGTVKNAELCAEECIKLEECVGFHYCSGKGECYVSTYDWDDNWGDEIKDAKSCTIYKRQEAGSRFKDVLLKDALENLKDAVTNKKFTIEIQIKNKDVVKYVATDFEDEVSPVTGGDYDNDMFSRVIGQKKFKSGEDDQSTQKAGEVLGASDCYRKCKDEKNIACSSFSFCSDTNECLLSPTLVLPGQDIDKSLDSSPLCSVYSINYLQMFEEYEGRVRISPGKDAISSDSASKCAKSCREKGVKACRGFDYCVSKKQCVFHEKHVLDIKGTNDLTDVGSGCSHYSLKYSADFVELGRFILSDPSSKRVSAVSLEDCAKMCSENIEFKCRSFDFCKSDDVTKLQCTLNTLTLEDNVKSDDSPSCQHYAKRDGLVDDYSQEKQPNTNSDSGYTPGGLAGVIIGVLIFGIAVGVIGFFIYAYVRKSRMANGTAVKFVNE